MGVSTEARKTKPCLQPVTTYSTALGANQCPKRSATKALANRNLCVKKLHKLQVVGCEPQCVQMTTVDVTRKPHLLGH